MTTIEDRVRDARERKGLTQAQLGRLIGLSADKVCKIEAGTRDVGGDELLTIAEVTDTRYQDLLREPVTVAFRGKHKKSAEQIATALAKINRFSDRWLEARALEEAFLD